MRSIICFYPSPSTTTFHHSYKNCRIGVAAACCGFIGKANDKSFRYWNLSLHQYVLLLWWLEVSEWMKGSSSDKVDPRSRAFVPWEWMTVVSYKKVSLIEQLMASWSLCFTNPDRYIYTMRELNYMWVNHAKLLAYLTDWQLYALVNGFEGPIQRQISPFLSFAQAFSRKLPQQAPTKTWLRVWWSPRILSSQSSVGWLLQPLFLQCNHVTGKLSSALWIVPFLSVGLGLSISKNNPQHPCPCLSLRDVLRFLPHCCCQYFEDFELWSSCA